MKGMLETKILSTLEREFSPVSLKIENTSADHASHRVQDGVETHFSIGVRSKIFNGMVSQTFIN